MATVKLLQDGTHEVLICTTIFDEGVDIPELRSVIMAGGGGTRLWPLSRKETPKQTLALDGERTLFGIAVQNGTSPMRISAFELSEDGMRVIGHRILEQAHSEWTEPLSGSIDGDALIYIGNGQWDRYFEGELKPGMEALPTEIRRLPLARSAG